MENTKFLMLCPAKEEQFRIIKIEGKIVLI